MQNIQWTNELICIATFIGFLLPTVGFLLAITIQGRKQTQLTTQLAHANNLIIEIQDRLNQTQCAMHQVELSGAKLQEQFRNGEINEQRLAQELTDRNQELRDLETKFKELTQKMYLSEKNNETAQTENRGFKEQIIDLRGRLTQSNQVLETERALVSDLKELLSQEGKKAIAIETLEKEAREQIMEKKETLGKQRSEFTQLQDRYQNLINEYTELKTTLERKEEHFKEQMQQLCETKQSLTQEFENLANKIFEEKGKTFTQTSQANIDNFLKPFREQIEGFQKRVNEVHDASIQGNTSLNSEIRKVLEIGLQMSKEANNLTSALKGDSQQRGAWGEAQLCRTLEISGLIKDTHYEEQSSFKDTDGKQKQTDYLIKLPGGKHIIIDSKVALNAYDRAVALDSPEEYKLAIKEHLNAVRRHIDDLALKDYTNLIGMHSPSFVLMFMPIEPAYIEALKSSKGLFEYGYKKGIVLVSHTTLIPILRTVSNLWMIEHSNSEAREISEKAGEIYNQVCLVGERLCKLGGTLSTVSNHYNNTVKALIGKQGLYGKIDRFSQISARVSKSLPQIEMLHMDFDTDRLQIIVEPVSEELIQPETFNIGGKLDDTSMESTAE